MRDYLKNISESNYWIYGVKDSDFDHPITLVDKIILAREEQFNLEKQRMLLELNEIPDIEIESDLAYYIYMDNLFLWQFALWRLQGLFEAVITSQFVNTTNPNKLIGLKSKLLALTTKGYTLNDCEFNELIDWAKLRNALSHAPPEEYSPINLYREDVVEYQNLVKSLYSRWLIEKANLI